MNNRSKILTALAFLVSIASSLSAELGQLVGDKDVRLTRHTVYVRKHATNASSTWKIIDANTKELPGISSLDGTKLPSNQAVIFDKIAIGFAKGTADNQAGELDYTSTKAPAVLRNANIVITQGNREVLDLPVADLVKTISPASQEDYYHDLEGLNYLVDGMNMNWEFRFPDGSVLDAAAGEFNFIEVRLQGFKTSRKV